MKLIAIDPGDVQSAYCLMDENRNPLQFDTVPNEKLLEMISNPLVDFMAIEMIACYGMPVGATTFETCLWIGRFIQAWNRPYRKIYRREVKIMMCNSMKAKDAMVAQALKDIYGDKGTKKNPGKLFGIKGDEWSALAVGVTYFRLLEEEARAQKNTQTAEEVRTGS